MELTKTSLMLPKDVLKQAKIRAIEEGISFGELIRRALNEYLSKKEFKKKEGKK
jgi:hypothetical protein